VYRIKKLNKRPGSKDCRAMEEEEEEDEEEEEKMKKKRRKKVF
jgi:hypothetical protein